MSHQTPRLKNGVDLQLQSAFEERNWGVVARLAERRARALKDQYYEILKVCAESRADDPNAAYLAVAAVDQFLKDGTVIKDPESIQLLEWATRPVTEESYFAQSLAPLRVRAVKAAPKDRNAAMFHLEECLLQWDLNSAQQIAAMLDRSFPQERTYMFWNIVITHLLATSPQAPPDKKKLYGMLAQKQIERAAQLTEQGQELDEAAKASTRNIQTEEEVLLLYDIVEKHGSQSDFEKLMASPIFSPLAQLRTGRKDVLLRVAKSLSEKKEWHALFSICKDSLSEKDDAGEPTLFASDSAVWQHFITAAKHLQSVDPKAKSAVKEVLHQLLESKKLRPIYKRILLLARVTVAFELETTDEDDFTDGKPSSNRLRELLGYISFQSTFPSCFDDVKEFVEKLDPPAMKFVAFEFTPKTEEEPKDSKDATRIRLLILKLQYFVSSCRTMYTLLPDDCLTTISQKAYELHQELDDKAADDPIKTEVQPDTAVLMAFCSIRLAAADSKSVYSAPSLSSTRHLLHALLILEHQASLTPNHSVLSLLLVQLHVLFGSGHRAAHHWEVLGVKRSIVDSLAPLFVDRLTSIAPSMISHTNSDGSNLIYYLKGAYGSLDMPMPRRLIDAFESSSYMSVLSLPPFMTNLRYGCTRVMSLVEEARSARLLGKSTRSLLHDIRYEIVKDDLELSEVVDYGYFPSWDSSSTPPAYTQLRVGPPLSDCRTHLALLCEAYHDVMASKQPPSYKGLAPATGADQVFLRETLTQLSNSLNKFLSRAAAYSTPAETVYFEIISLLAMIIPLCASPDRPASLSSTLAPLADAIEAGLDTLYETLPTLEGAEITPLVLGLRSMHNLTMFRDSVVAARLATQWILSFSERKTERDASGRSNIPKDTLTRVKALQAKTDAALKQGKAWISKMKEDVATQPGFDQKFKKWALENAGVVGEFVGDAAVAELLGSSKKNLKVWAQIKWE